jgi:hypothetical protein
MRCRSVATRVGFVMVMASPGFALGQEPGPPPKPVSRETLVSAFTVVLENDVLAQLGHNQDRNYTGGLALSASGRFIPALHLDAPLVLLDGLSGAGKRHKDATQVFHTLTFAGTGFTPDLLNSSDIVRGDRPYGSIVALSVSKTSVERALQRSAWTSQFAVGILGLDVVGDAQTKIHQWNRRRSGKETPYDPLGWQHQISDGGEPTAMYRVGYQRLLAGDSSGKDIRKHFQLTGGVEGSIGHYTNAAVGATGRLGWFNSDFWEFVPNAMAFAAQKADGKDAPRIDAFLFGAIRPKLVLYNALLEGQVKKSAYTVYPERVLIELDLGAALTYKPLHLHFVWIAYAGRTSEFTTSEPRTHTWGSYTLSFVFGR